MTWHAHSGPRRSATGKFRSQSRLGTEKTAGGNYRDWSYSFVTHQTGSGIRRTRFAVSICDPSKNRVAYLRDFSCLERATVAAEQWIDQRLAPSPANPVVGSASFRKGVGRIPPLPSNHAVSHDSGKIADGVPKQL